jgi:hypothetical protein
VTFRSEVSVRRDAALRVNARLRRFGINPVPPLQSSWRDQAKQAVDRALGLVERVAKKA